MLTSKARVHAALEGRAVDRNPVTVLYNQLYYRDHLTELTGEPAWRLDAWLHGTPEAYLALYRRMVEAAPFELLQPEMAPPRAERERFEYLLFDDIPCRRDRHSGDVKRLPEPISGHAFDDRAVETRQVFDVDDVSEHVHVARAEERIAAGELDYVRAVVAAYGGSEFILSGGVIGVLYSCSWYVGLTNLYALLIDQPRLVDYLCRRILDQNMETIRMLASAGGDAIYIDDATATSDMISVAHYERYSLPYMVAMVEEIHRLGHKAIVIYYGGVEDRLDLIASIGADGLQMETRMKRYVNDIAAVVQRIGHQVTLLGNVDPVSVLQDATDDEMALKMARQAEAGRAGRGFIMATGSPITPSTPLARVQRFLELGRTLS